MSPVLFISGCHSTVILVKRHLQCTVNNKPARLCKNLRSWLIIFCSWTTHSSPFHKQILLRLVTHTQHCCFEKQLLHIWKTCYLHALHKFLANILMTISLFLWYFIHLHHRKKSHTTYEEFSSSEDYII